MGRVTLYTKPDCPLCDRAESLVRKLQGEFGYQVEVVDITQDRALLERYRFEIPVVTAEGRMLVSGRIEEATLREALQVL